MEEVDVALMDRERVARLGRETVAILRSGGYSAPSGRYVDLHEALDRCRDATEEFPPDRVAQVPAGDQFDTRITIENDTVLAVGRRLRSGGPVAALNFASATHPGGGFLTGARAQEESIARSSGLFVALEGRAMYRYHREHQDAMHADWVIYSPDVPIIRTDDGELLEDPWTLSIVTCPAPHGVALARYAPGRLGEIPGVMAGRTAKMLAVAARQHVRRFVLGAWGCGAFGLDSEMVARTFHDALAGPYRGVFDEIVFAITDWSSDQHTIEPFRRLLGG